MTFAMANYADEVKRAANRKGMSIADVARELKYDYDAFNSAIRGRSQKNQPVMLQAVRELLTLPPNWPEETGLPEGVRRVFGKEMVPMKRAGAASAGSGTDSNAEDEIIWVPSELAGNRGVRIGTTVVGDSMSPWLQDSDIAVFEPSGYAVDGLTYLLFDSENQAFVKLLKYREGVPWAVSLNKNYEPFRLDDKHRMAGFLVGFWRVEGTEYTIKANDSGLRPREFF